MAKFRFPAKIALLIAVLLLVAGLAVSTFLLPSKEDQAVYESLDAQRALNAPSASVPNMEELKAAFEAEKQTATLTFETTKAYAEALQSSGYLEGGIAAWNDFLSANPDHVQAWENVGSYYQSGGDEENYQRSLEELVRLEPNETRLNALSGYYNYRKEYHKQIGVLDQLVGITNESNPDYILALADIAGLVAASPIEASALSDGASEEEKLAAHSFLEQEEAKRVAAREKAIGALILYYDKFSDQADSARVEPLVRLLAQAGRKEDAVGTAVNLSTSQPAEFKTRLADVLLFEAGPAHAIDYMDRTATGGVMLPQMRPVYARALVQQENQEKALPLLRELKGDSTEYRELYFLALSNASKQNKKLRPELIEHVEESFAAGDLTEAQKRDRVYALLGIGEKATALDYVERSLQAAEGDERLEWKKLYTALTLKPQASKRRSRARRAAAPRQTLDQRLVLAGEGKYDEKKLRQTAFEALNAGRKADAVDLFKMLAAYNGSQSTDAGQLIYLQGARIGGDDLRWVIDQANQAQGAEQSGWISLVANHASLEDINAVAQAYPSWLGHSGFSNRYVSALLQSGDQQAIASYLQSQASANQNVEAYLAVASQAEAMMDKRTAGQALLNAASIAPNDRTIWLRLTQHYFSTAEYSEAAIALDRALQANSSSAISPEAAAREQLVMNYYVGQVRTRDGDKEVASQYFSQAVAGGNRWQGDRDAHTKFLVSQMAAGDAGSAAQGFEGLLSQTPGDAVLLADYLSATLDRRDYDAAQQIVDRHSRNITFNGGADGEMIAAHPIILSGANGEMPLAQVMSAGSEVKLQFARPLPAGFSLLDSTNKPHWISYATTSYDSVLMVANSGYQLQANPTSQGLQITPVKSAPATSTDAMRQQFLRLQLLYTRQELETGNTSDALERLQSLSSEFEDNSEFLGYQGNAEYYAANLTRGLHLVKKAHALAPQNEDLRYLKRNIERFHAEHLKADYEWQKIGKHHLHIGTLEARKQFNGGWEATARHQQAFVTTSTVQRANGPLATFEGSKWNSQLSLAKFMDDSSLITGNLYGNKTGAGAGLAYQFVNQIGTTGVYADYHKPYWGLVEAVVEDATRDRVAAWHLWRPSPKWSVRVEGAYNRYHTDDDSNLVDSVGASGTILRTIWGKSPYVALAYGFDGEYHMGHVKRGNFGGGTHKLLPLRSREVHALSAIYYQDFTAWDVDDTNLELNAGYAVDRLGEHGPSVEGRLTHFVTDDVDVQIRGRYGLEVQETDNNAATIGGYVRWIW